MNAVTFSHSFTRQRFTGLQAISACNPSKSLPFSLRPFLSGTAVIFAAEVRLAELNQLVAPR
ncbi:hypothetical protein [Rhizobium sp. BK491]|uniref:hypothetical protein n=1 Tax=Rhizobium sp. BK491 TaxID=2587009 RepID=UPI001613DF92|nr:hypothetical protein [Rhizobium sp. BK491]MBB3565983.1 hypothetical protein [Rhizobium sp. BK491]